MEALKKMAMKKIQTLMRPILIMMNLNQLRNVILRLLRMLKSVVLRLIQNVIQNPTWSQRNSKYLKS